MLGGIQNGVPVVPTVIATDDESGFLEFGYSILNDDGSVIFEAIAPGDTDFSLYLWKDGSTETLLETDNVMDIFLGWQGFAMRNGRLVFSDADTVYIWTRESGIQEIFTISDGISPGDEFRHSNGQRIRPESISWGLLQNILGIDDQGRIAVNIEWEDEVETILLVTPNYPPLNRLDVSGLNFQEGVFEMTFDGAKDAMLKLEGSTDLVEWSNITNFNVGEESPVLIDPDAGTFDNRFYRVVPDDTVPQ